MSKEKKDNKKRFSVLALLLILVALAGLGYSAYQVISFYKPDIESKNEVQELVELAVGTPLPEGVTPVRPNGQDEPAFETPAPIASDNPDPTDIASSDEPKTTEGSDPSSVPAVTQAPSDTAPASATDPAVTHETTPGTTSEIRTPAPTGSTVDPGQTEGSPQVTPKPSQGSSPASPIYVDFNKLQNINSDICAWLYSAGTPINYPVMYSSDNIYYLDHLYNGSYNPGGSLFVDYRNNRDFSDINTLIFGHNNKSGSMFGTLKGYKNQSYYNKHPYMWLYTPEHTYRLELIAGLITKSNSTPYTLFETQEELHAFLVQAVQDSTFKSGVDIEFVDRIVTLSTCSYEYNNARFVVIGYPVQID